MIFEHCVKFLLAEAEKAARRGKEDVENRDGKDTTKETICGRGKKDVENRASVNGLMNGVCASGELHTRNQPECCQFMI